MEATAKNAVLRQTEGWHPWIVFENDLPELGLQKGDRIEPSWEMQNTADAHKQPTEYPMAIQFWRRSEETRARHRNPLFDSPERPAIGINILSLALDVLHTIHLGCAQYVVLASLWALFAIDVFGTGISGMEERVAASTQLLQAALFRWYGERHTMLLSEKLTHINTLRATMFGAGPQGPLKTKAA